MESAMNKLITALKNPLAQRVYYLASTEEAVLSEAAAIARKELLAQAQGEEVTRIDGPTPDIGEVIAASGAISFFGTPRIVELWNISPSAMKAKDVQELQQLFEQLENAILLVTCIYNDKKAATSKNAKALFETAKSIGFAAQLAKPTRREMVEHVRHFAVSLQTDFPQGAVEQLIDRTGDSQIWLQNETAKLAAISGYTTITKDMVRQYATSNLEADVFELVRAIIGSSAAAVYKKMAELQELRHEPIAISAALASSFVDMYRVQQGVQNGKTISTIFKDMGYKGSEYRLQKAKENARSFTQQNLMQAILCLEQLDKQLKSSALPNKNLLLTATIGRILQLRKS